MIASTFLIKYSANLGKTKNGFLHNFSKKTHIILICCHTNAKRKLQLSVVLYSLLAIH